MTETCRQDRNKVNILLCWTEARKCVVVF